MSVELVLTCTSSYYLHDPKFMFFSKFSRPSESEITFASLGLGPPYTKTHTLALL